MKLIQIEKSGHIARITMSRAPLNALSLELIEELRGAIRQVSEDNDTWAFLIDSSVEGFFSNGLDPELLLPLDVSGRLKVFDAFLGMCRDLYALTKPSLSLVNGHAMAGGAVIASMTDFRFLAEGKYSFCFTEVRVGLTLPPMLIEVIERITGPQHLRRIAMLADRFKPEECLAMGLADRLVPAADLLSEGRKYLESMLDLPQASLRSVKEELRRPALASFDRMLRDPAGFARFLGANFEEGLRSVVERRRPKFQNP